MKELWNFNAVKRRNLFNWVKSLVWKELSCLHLSRNVERKNERRSVFERKRNVERKNVRRNAERKNVKRNVDS